MYMYSSTTKKNYAGIHIVVLKYIFLYSNTYFCSEKNSSSLYWNIHYCTGIFTVALEYIYCHVGTYFVVFPLWVTVYVGKLYELGSIGMKKVKRFRNPALI